MLGHPLRRHLVERPKPLAPRKSYDQVFLFVPTSVAMHQRILYLLKHTHRYHSLLVYTPRDMAQLLAATILQSTYRSYRARTQCQFVKLFLQRRAILCIQRWWRTLSTLTWGLDMYEACVRLVAAIDSSVLYIEERVFMTLKHPSLTQRALSTMPRMPSHEWKFKFSNRQLRMPITLEESLSRLPEDEKQAYLNTFYVENGLERVGFPLWLPSKPQHEIVGREEKQVSKQQVGLIVTSYCVESVVTDAVDAPAPLDDVERCSDVDFGHFAACRNILQDNVALLKWDDPVDMQWNKVFGITFVKLEFDSVTEARHRAAMLLVKTYDARHKSYARLRDWMRLRLEIPSKWGYHHDAYTYHGENSPGEVESAQHMLLQRGHRPSTVPGANEAFSASDVTASTSLCSQLLSSHIETNNEESCGRLGSPTVAMVVHHVQVQVDVDPTYQLHLLKQQQADTVRLESEALETKLHHARSLALKAKQVLVANTQFTPRRPPDALSASSTHVAKSRKAKFEGMLHAVDGAIKADEAGEARAAAILHRMRLSERAHQAVVVERKMGARENAAMIAAHKIKIDAQLQRAAYEHAQLLLVKKQRKAVEVALATRKKAQRQFAQNFGQKTVGLTRCHARDRTQDRAVAAFVAPMERVQFAKVAERKVDESIRSKRTDMVVANQRTRVIQCMEIQAALEFQDAQERQRLDDIHARISQERKLKQLLQTDDF
ncbi:hypothetical protein DYB32_004700 [Aphanomyces invadans]|uniref:Uncharacterized protein n=1 Tax=Aphanomyces invadans TaxID=157072 RepID=A0A418AWR2_9STRA|nr:hypothetical protein DYB32_004700 [Aphanomyces invadans]